MMTYLEVNSAMMDCLLWYSLSVLHTGQGYFPKLCGLEWYRTLLVTSKLIFEPGNDL